MSYESEENIPGKSVLTMGDAAATDAVLRDQLCETLRKQRFKLQTEVSCWLILKICAKFSEV